MRIAHMGWRALALAVMGCVVHTSALAMSASDYKIVYSGADVPASFQEPINNSGYALVSGGAWSQSGGFVSTADLLSRSNLPQDGEAGSFALRAIDSTGRIAFTGPYVPGCSLCIQTIASKDYYGVMSLTGEVLLSESWVAQSGSKYRADSAPDRMQFTSSGALAVSWQGSDYVHGRSVVYDPSFKSYKGVEGEVVSINNNGQLLTIYSGHYVSAAPLRGLYALQDLNSGELISGMQFDPSFGYMTRINDLGQVLFYNDDSKVYTVMQGPSAAVPEASTWSMWGLAGLLALLCLRARDKPVLPADGARCA